MFNHKKHKISGKRGIVEVQFNWIFVMIVGALLLLFIVSIVLSQKKQADVFLNAEVLRQLTASIKGKQQLSSSFNEISIPKTNVYFSCSLNTKIFDYKIEGSQREVLTNDIIFAPRVLNGKKLLLWTEDFNLPFLVTRFTYITTDDYAYIFYYAGAADKFRTERLFNDTHHNITRQYNPLLPGIAGINALPKFSKSKVICIDTGPPLVCPTAVQAPNMIRINPIDMNNIYLRGTVRFRINGGAESGPIGYVGKTALFGAIFSDNRDYYQCQMDRAYAQFNVKRTMLMNKMDFLSKDLDLTHNAACRDALIAPKFTLDAMRTLNYNSDLTLITRLENANKDMNFQGCPYIY